jgi:hypothetical protein
LGAWDEAVAAPHYIRGESSHVSDDGNDPDHVPYSAFGVPLVQMLEGEGDVSGCRRIRATGQKSIAG